MSNFWDNISGSNLNLSNTSGGFNIQEFIKFYNENKGKDMNQTLNQLIQSGKVSQEQVNNASSQAQNILQMLMGLGMFK